MRTVNKATNRRSVSGGVIMCAGALCFYFSGKRMPGACVQWGARDCPREKHAGFLNKPLTPTPFDLTVSCGELVVISLPIWFSLVLRDLVMWDTSRIRDFGMHGIVIEKLLKNSRATSYIGN